MCNIQEDQEEGTSAIQHSEMPRPREHPRPRLLFSSPLTTTGKSRGFDKPCLEVNEVAALRHHELCCLGAAG